MIIILSQKIDTESSYSDEIFTSYHYPARYRNQIHKGDTFIYYQGNRYRKEQRYYFGVGTIGSIFMLDEGDYRAQLVDCYRFSKIVPIYLPNSGYIEQLGFETVRKSPIPPWQSSIRPLSTLAFDYIISESGLDFAKSNKVDVDEKKELLKKAIRKFYLENNKESILEIENLATELVKELIKYK